MDMKSLSMKMIGASVFSIALTYQIGYYATIGAAQLYRYDYAFAYWPALISMAIGLVLLAYDFSGCCKPAVASKAKK